MNDEPPVSHADLRALFELLDVESGNGHECDHEFTLTRQFLAEHRLPEEDMLRWLGENGAGCDCEVIFNVEQQWGERVGFEPKESQGVADQRAAGAGEPRPTKPRERKAAHAACGRIRGPRLTDDALMSRSKDDRVGWWDEGLVPVALLLFSYAGVLVPASVWTLLGVLSMLLGALLTFAMWRGAALHHRGPSPATRCAVWMLKLWVVWTLAGRALVGWLSG